MELTTFQPSGPPICHQAVCGWHHSPTNARFGDIFFMLVSIDPGVSSEDSKLLHSPLNTQILILIFI